MSNNIGYTELAPGSDHPEVIANTNAGKFDAALTEDYAVDLSSGDAALTLAQLRGAAFFMLNGATQARTVTLEPVKRTLLFRNYGTADVTIKVGAGTVVVKAGKGASVRLSGTQNGIEDLSAGVSSGAALPVGGTLNQMLGKKSATDGDVEWQYKDGYRGFNVSFAGGLTEVTLTEADMFNMVALAVMATSMTANSTVIFPAWNGWFTFRNPSQYTVTLKMGTGSFAVPAYAIVFVRLAMPNSVQVTIAYLPMFGTTGQVLRKKTNTNNDVEWAGYAVPAGGAAGQVPTKASNADGDIVWATPAAGGGGSSDPIGGSSAHKYWRIVALESNHSDQRYFIVNELEMRNKAGAANLATGGSPLSNGNYTTNVAANAFDGNLTTYYETSGQEFNGITYTNTKNYLGYNFPNPVAINHITIKLGTAEPNERLSRAQVQYSDDGINWSDAWQWAGINQTNNSTSTTVNPDFNNGTNGSRSYTLAEANALANLRNGDQVYISNGRKAGEAASAGTGIPAYYSGGSWRTYRDDTAVTT